MVDKRKSYYEADYPYEHPANVFALSREWDKNILLGKSREPEKLFVIR